MSTSVSSFALTAAALFAVACSGAQTAPADPSMASGDMASAESVKCLGIHECKGQSQCGVKDGHSCAGQNSCRGKGWVKVPQAECAEKGGTVL